MNFKEVFNFDNIGMLSTIALLIFLGVFFAVTIRVFMRSSNEMKAASQLPLDEAQNSN